MTSRAHANIFYQADIISAANCKCGGAENTVLLKSFSSFNMLHFLPGRAATKPKSFISLGLCGVNDGSEASPP